MRAIRYNGSLSLSALTVCNSCPMKVSTSAGDAP